MNGGRENATAVRSVPSVERADGRFAETVGRYRRHLGQGRAAMGELLGGVVEVGSEGPWVLAATGERYLDFGGYGVFILGHRHPRVVAAVRHQLDTHPLATRVFLEPVAAEAAEALAEVSPAGLDYVQFVNSGAEATEAGLKLARAHGRTALICTHSGFHGKTLGALSVTANPLYQRRFEPLLPDVAHVRYGDLDQMRAALTARRGRACVILEPVQGEGGVVLPPPGYLRGVAEACAEYDAFLIVDEIQTGMGRLGSWWGVDADAVVPDVLLVGKGLSGGVVPVGAIVARAEAFAPFSRDPYLHTSTFGGSPLAAAAALASIGSCRDEDIPGRAARLGKLILDGVRDACARRCPDQVAEVRGHGLLIGVEFHEPAHVGEAVLALLDRGVLANHSLNAATVLRLTPPAVLGDAELALFFTAFDEALRSVAAS